MKHSTELDPISLEIYCNRLISIADEAATGLVRTAFSTIVRESNDYATVLMDANADSIAENTGGIASFSCILPRTTKKFLEKFPAEQWAPGDVVLSNDPWLGTGHLPDFVAVSGVFHKGGLVGFIGSIAHSPDVGGSLWSADCREIYEEGIRVPPSLLMKRGVWNEELIELLKSNVRMPREVFGDLQAQVVANDVGSRRLVEFMEDTGLNDLRGLSSSLHRLTDQAMRRAISAVPDGTYRSTIHADGFDEHTTRIVCAVTVAGDTMHIDYAGSSEQIARGINCVMNYTHAYSVYPIKCALDPFTARNEGSYKAITVSAPEGSILNPAFPAPVSARQLTGHMLAGAIYKALAQVLPDKVIAECVGAPTMRGVFSGYGDDGNRFSQLLFSSGGMGAGKCRDGLSTTAFPTNVGAGSIEAFESIAPIVVWTKELRVDSGGGGTYRGGLGQTVKVEIMSSRPIQLSLLSDRHRHPATGIEGGLPGAPSVIALRDGSRPHPKSKTVIHPGEIVTMMYAGGGGYGDPRKRSHDAIRDDVENGYVSAEAASKVYGLELAE